MQKVRFQVERISLRLSLCLSLSLSLCSSSFSSSASKLTHSSGCSCISQDFIVQTGDPTGTGRGGSSINGVLYGEQARYFEDEKSASKLKHVKSGTVAMANAGKDMNASQFYITTKDNLDSLNGKHTIFGEVTEGFDAVMRINDAYCDETGRPWQVSR